MIWHERRVRHSLLSVNRSFYRDPRPDLDAKEELLSQGVSGLLNLASLDLH